MRSIPAAWRWAFVVLIVVVAVAVAVWPRGAGHPAGPSAGRSARPIPADSVERAAAALDGCPPSTAGASGPLVGITVDCLADGRSVDLAGALAGRPALLNLWAYWCQPCAHELPALQQFAARAGAAVTVLTVHSDPDEAKALARLSDLGIHLPGVQDGDARVRAAAAAPAVLPVSVLVRADGSIAKVVVRPFDSVDDIAATLARELGVTT